MKRILAGAAIVAVAAIGLPLMASTAATAGGNSSNAKACQKNGWTTKYDANGQPFANEQACTSYGANGGVFGTPTTTTTAPACTGTPTTRLTPSGGVKDAGTLTVDASGSTDPCGRSLLYFWTCKSPQQSSVCTTFMVAAQAGGFSTYDLPLGDGDDYTVTVQACVHADDNTNCGNIVKWEYLGQATT